VTIFKAHRLDSFLLPYWMNSKGLWAKMNALSASKKLVEMVQVNKVFGLH